MAEKESLTSRPEPARVPWLHVIACGLLLTALNAIKPVHIDDPAYLTYAAEFATHPLDPYAFQYGSPYVAPANNLLVPPVMSYWLGAGITLFGDHPVILKLWLLPFALMLSWAIAAVAARVAPSLRVPLLWLGLISPTVLPSFNFMLEVPVLALGLTALVIAMRASERDSWPAVLLAGVLAGVAVQTKYTGIVSCAVVGMWCVLNGRPARGVVAVVTAVAVAVSWECVVAHAQGESHFLIHLKQRQGQTLLRAARLILPLLTQVAGLAPAVALLGLKALGWSNRNALVAGLGVAAGFAALALVPSQAAVLESSNGKPILTPSNIVYALFAAIVWITVGAVCFRLLKQDRSLPSPDRTLRWFLLSWLALELGGYFALSPFPAARRVVAVVMVLTFIVGRLAHLRGVPARAASGVAAFGVGLALLFFTTDWLEARAGQVAAQRVARGSNRPTEGGTFWHLSWWGFSYYADREGMAPLQLNARPVRPGDLIAVQDMPEFLAVLARYPQLVLERIDTVVANDDFPLRLAPGYYDGRTPMENQRGGRLRIFVYRVVAVTSP